MFRPENYCKHVLRSAHNILNAAAAAAAAREEKLVATGNPRVDYSPVSSSPSTVSTDMPCAEGILIRTLLVYPYVTL